ncbi:MAG: M23 family metallopeptidase, partial [Alphaproteobacteria bacterium]
AAKAVAPAPSRSAAKVVPNRKPATRPTATSAAKATPKAARQRPTAMAKAFARGPRAAAYRTAAAATGQATERRVIALGDDDETLIDVLARENVAADDLVAAVEAFEDIEERARLGRGDRIELVLDGQNEDGDRNLSALRVVRSGGGDITLVRAADGKFAAAGMAGTTTTLLTLTGVVEGSWHHSLAQAGVPMDVTEEIDRLIALDLDLPRPVPQGATFEVLAERHDRASGGPAHTVRYVGVVVRGYDHRTYRYMPHDGPAGYFDEQGRSIAPLSLAIPVADARLTSDFGWRRHPKLKRRMFHRGVDLAAPIGTPIVASADGTIEWAGWRGAYGRYVRIAHGNGVSTGYGHLRDYAPGITDGVTVRQGEVIGFVGSSGRSTGPHVDFSVLVDGKPVNPMHALMPAPRDLRGPELVAFRNHVAQLHGQASLSP